MYCKPGFDRMRARTLAKYALIVGSQKGQSDCCVVLETAHARLLYEEPN